MTVAITGLKFLNNDTGRNAYAQARVEFATIVGDSRLFLKTLIFGTAQESVACFSNRAVNSEEISESRQNCPPKLLRRFPQWYTFV